MDKREVCFILGDHNVVLWSDASASPVALPDSRMRWQQIWRLRAKIVEIAHTHPLGGLHFSQTDETTMLALDSALGRTLCYSVVTPQQMLRRASERAEDCIITDEPWWVALIRVASGVATSQI